MSNLSYGLLSYDVPIHRQSAYNKLRKAIRARTIMATWSCYFFPWQERDSLARLIEDLNEDLPKKDKITFSLLKFDPSEEDKLAQMVVDGIQKVMAGARDLLIKRILDTKKKLEAGEAQLIDLKQTIGQGHRDAMKAIKEAEGLAIRFEQSGNMVDAIASYSKMIEAIVAEQRDEYQKLQDAENAIATAKANASKDEVVCQT